MDLVRMLIAAAAALVIGIPFLLATRLRQNRWRVCYDYEVDGVAYSYKCTLGAPVPERVSLYYPEGRPDRAEIWGAVQRRRGPAYTLRALVPVAVWAAVYWLLALAEVGGGA